MHKNAHAVPGCAHLLGVGDHTGTPGLATRAPLSALSARQLNGGSSVGLTPRTVGAAMAGLQAAAAAAATAGGGRIRHNDICGGDGVQACDDLLRGRPSYTRLPQRPKDPCYPKPKGQARKKNSSCGLHA